MSFSPKYLATAIGTMPQKDFVQYIPQMIENGAPLIGGCCGTNPDYIRRMAEIINE
jgi:5-methyltetrahydrofolate--homocysteine methyltransferase